MKHFRYPNRALMIFPIKKRLEREDNTTRSHDPQRERERERAREKILLYFQIKGQLTSMLVHQHLIVPCFFYNIIV